MLALKKQGISIAERAGRKLERRHVPGVLRRRGYQVFSFVRLCMCSFSLFWQSLPLNFTADASFSFFKQLSSSSWSALQHAPITMNFHHDGVDPGLYSSSSRFGLRRFFRMLSTNVDRKGRPFVSSVQGVLHPNIQGTQFHPERPAFEFSNAAGDQGLVHTRQSVATNNEIAIALVDQARMSNRSFASWDEAEAHLLYNYNPQFMGQSLMLYTY